MGRRGLRAPARRRYRAGCIGERGGLENILAFGERNGERSVVNVARAGRVKRRDCEARNQPCSALVATNEPRAPSVIITVCTPMMISFSAARRASSAVTILIPE